MYIVEWCDHEGNLQQRSSANEEDAKLEAARLKEKFDHVAVIWETEV